MRATLELKDEDREQLKAWLRGSKTEQRMVTRAKIVLRLSGNGSVKDCAAREKVNALTVSKWRDRYLSGGILGLQDAPRSGKPVTYGAKAEKRILSMLDDPAPEGYARWNGTLLAKALRDISPHFIWRVLRKHKISLERRHSWCISTDPEFTAKAADVVGLYLSPPTNAIVICVDEKPSIQALERSQGWLKLPNGKAITGFSHNYKRHGTTTLFAALEVATGLVHAGHFNRRRRREFLAFMNELVAKYPKKEIHVVLDNLNTHKPKRDMWLKRNPNVHFHYTPTSASWLNQVEIWFSLLSRHALAGASFTHVNQVRQQIDKFIAAHNDQAAPFEWTKADVRPRALKAKYADLCK